MKLLLPVDGSQSSYQSSLIATTIAKAMESDITIVNVISGSGPTGMEISDAREFATAPDYGSISISVGVEGRRKAPALGDQGAEAVISAVRSQIPLGDDRVKTDVMRFREPPRGILELAEQGLYDLIIIGNGDDDKWESNDVGEVALKIVRDAQVPVMVVKRRSGLSRITALFYQDDEKLLEMAVEMSRVFESRLNIIAIEGSEEGCGDVFISKALQKVTDHGVKSTSCVVKDDEAEVISTIESAQTETLLVGKAKLGVLGRIARRNEWIHKLVKDCPCSVLLMT